MKQTAWLVQRAVLAVVLMVSFYALALGVAAALAGGGPGAAKVQPMDVLIELPAA